MARDSSAPKLRCADPIGSQVERPRAKPLRVLTSLSVTEDGDAGRKAASNRRAALKLLQLRAETQLTQIDLAALSGDSSRSIGAWERGEVDLGPLRVFVMLLEFRMRQRGEG